MPERLHASYAPGERLAALSIPVDATLVVAGAVATRDFSPLHHDADYARTQAGHREIFLNTPTQLALIERYLVCTLGAQARIGRLRSRMTAPVHAGAMLSIEATVHDGAVDAVGCGWLHIDIALYADGAPASRCAARIAVPRHAGDDPWHRQGSEWQP